MGKRSRPPMDTDCGHGIVPNAAIVSLTICICQGCAQKVASDQAYLDVSVKTVPKEPTP